VKRSSPTPQALASSPAHGVYAPAHDEFFKSPDGKQDWIIFHANGGPDWKCTARRAPYIMPFSWSDKGKPDFMRGK
jgi:GH43 family beta-xylosidase